MRFLGAAACLAALAWSACAQAANVNDFINYTLTQGANTLLRGRLYVPPAAISDPTTPRPLVLFLHGAGETGTDNLAQINSNLDNLLAYAKHENAFLYAPQTTSSWTATSVTSNVFTMIEQAEDDYNIDAGRLYVTGLSMGGGGAWNMLNRYPTTFAAGIPICGVTPGADFNPANLLDQSIWAYHARNDDTVSVTTTRDRVNQILTAAGQAPLVFPPFTDTTNTFAYFGVDPEIRYTERPTGGHSIWSGVYNNSTVMNWMFSHTLAVPEPSSIVSMSVAGVLLAVYGWRRSRPRVLQHSSQQAEK